MHCYHESTPNFSSIASCRHSTVFVSSNFMGSSTNRRLRDTAAHFSYSLSLLGQFFLLVHLNRCPYHVLWAHRHGARSFQAFPWMGHALLLTACQCHSAISSCTTHGTHPPPLADGPTWAVHGPQASMLRIISVQNSHPHPVLRIWYKLARICQVWMRIRIMVNRISGRYGIDNIRLRYFCELSEVIN